MQEINKHAFDLMVFSGVSKIPFGENVKDFYLGEFRHIPGSWDKFFKEGKWQDMDEASRHEREEIIEKELSKFDVERKTLDL